MMRRMPNRETKSKGYRIYSFIYYLLLLLMVLAVLFFREHLNIFHLNAFKVVCFALLFTTLVIRVSKKRMSLITAIVVIVYVFCRCHYFAP